jgi:hypothetical protein
LLQKIKNKERKKEIKYLVYSSRGDKIKGVGQEYYLSLELLFWRGSYVVISCK